MLQILTRARLFARYLIPVRASAWVALSLLILATLTGISTAVSKELDLLNESQRLLAEIQSPNFTYPKATHYLETQAQFYAELEALNFNLQQALVNAPRIIETLWLARLAARQKLEEFSSYRALQNVGRDHPHVAATRNFLRNLRYFEDSLGELYFQKQKVEQSNVYFEGGAPALLVKPGIPTPFGLRSGDVILIRGWNPLNAAIARVGDMDSQFSHVILVYQDLKTKKFFGVDSNAGQGVAVRSIEQIMKMGGRAVIFRYRDPDLAARAAFHIYQEVLARKKIPYDYSLNLHDSSRMFCSEIIFEAYRRASHNWTHPLLSSPIPLFSTRFNMKNRDFLNRMGVTTVETFAPGDIELDPRFEMVAEWRHFASVWVPKYQDMIMTQVFEWQENEDLKMREISTRNPFHLSFWTSPLMVSYVARLLLRPISQWEWARDRSKLLKMVYDVIPKDMNRRALATVIILDNLSYGIQAHLEKHDQAHLKRWGFPMSPSLLLKKIDEIRIAHPSLVDPYMK